MTELNVSIIAEYLSEHISATSKDPAIDLTLKAADIFSAESTEREIKTDVLYIVDADSLDDFAAVMQSTACGGSLSLAFTGDYREDIDERINKSAGNAEWLFFKEGIGMIEALRLISETFRHYSEWKDDILRALLNRIPVGKMLDICAKEMKNPFALIDTYSTVIGVGGRIPEKPDAVWEPVLHDKFLRPQDFPTVNEKTFFDSPVPLYKEVPELSVNFACCALHSQGRLAALIGETEIYAPISMAQLSLLYLLQRILDDADAMSFLLRYSDGRMSYTLDRLLKGENIGNETVRFFLARQKWKADDSFQLIYVYRAGDEDTSFDEDERRILANRIARALPGSVFAFPETGIVVLRNKSLEIEEGTLKLICSRYEACAVTSAESFPLPYIHLAYSQCITAAKANPDAEEGSLLRFGECYTDCLLAKLGETCDISLFCMPEIMRIGAGSNGGEYIKCLKTYLLNGRNMTDTARKLYLHRNTLIYRIEKMEKEIGMNFSEANDNQLISLLFSCLIFERLQCDGKGDPSCFPSN